LIIILAVLSGVAADDFELPPNEADFELPPNIVFDSTTVSGIFLGYEVGDYIHPVLRTDTGKILSLWSTDPLMDYFLTCHIDEAVVLEIEEADSYIWEIGDMMRIFRVIGVTTGTTTFSLWRDSIAALGEPQDLLGDYFSAPYNCLLEESEMVSP